MADKNPRQQIIDTLKDVDNVLVTVNSNPSVDELSAALGFTLLLNKAGKHATSIFSGDIPPAINFLDPEKTFENTVDSLRDFIIALDKEKADHLRYKVDGDMVKIFITPYQTTISEDDLEFSQGDYNVEMVVAIGVENEDDLDRALSEHGKIMHDATVASLSISSESELGTIHWLDREASSYSEMLYGVAEQIRKDKNLIDEQISTAFMTGIVAATQRFSNDATTSNAMTIAAKLMAAGANQQLIATQLEEAKEIAAHDAVEHTDEPRRRKRSRKSNQQEEPQEEVTDRQAPDGTMRISHEKKGDLDEVTAQTEREQLSEAALKAEEALQRASLPDNDAALAAKLAAYKSHHPAPGGKAPSIEDLHKDLQAAKHEIDEAADEPGDQPQAPAEQKSPEPAPDDLSFPTPAPVDHFASAMPQYEPSMGGTLNATTDQAAEDKRREELSDRNKKTLSHDHGTNYVAGPPPGAPSINSFSGDSFVDNAPEPVVASPFDTPAPSRPKQPSTHGPTLQPLSGPPQDPFAPAPPMQSSAPAPAMAPQTPPEVDDLPELPPSQDHSGETLADLDKKYRMSDHDAARADIEAALGTGSVLSDGPMPPLPPTPTNLTSDPGPSAMPPQPMQAPQVAPMTDNSLPPLPPMPDFSTLPPLPGAGTPDPTAALDQVVASQPLPQQPEQPQSNDPAQFQIPSQ